MTFRLTSVYEACLSLSFDSDDDAEIERNKNKFHLCINHFVSNAEKYIQKDHSEYVQEQLERKMDGESFKCTRDEGFYYWCESDKYKCHSSYDPTAEIFDFDKGTCTPISKKENEPVENGLKWYDKAIGDYTATDAADFLNSRTSYSGKFSCTETRNLRWTCENDGYICNLYGLSSQPSNPPKYTCEPK